MHCCAGFNDSWVGISGATINTAGKQLLVVTPADLNPVTDHTVYREGVMLQAIQVRSDP